MKKKSLTMVSVLTLVTLLAGGCGQNPTTPTSSKESAVEETAEAQEQKPATDKITIFQSKTEIMNELNLCIEEFTAETGIQVELWETTGDSYYTDLKTDLSTEAGPTLFSLAPGAESVEMADYLEDISDLSFISEISEGMVDEVDGRQVGIPYTLEGFGLVYNASLVQPSNISNLEQLVDFLKQSKTDGKNGIGFSQEDYFLIMHVLNTPFSIQADPDAFLQSVLSGETRMIDQEAFQEFAKLMEAVRTSCTNPVDITYDGNCGDFATGKTAMIHQGNWCYSMFADYDTDFDMGLAAVPLCGNQKVSVSVPAAWYINVDATEGEKASAKAFLEWLYTSETGSDFMMNHFGFVPVVEGMTSEKLDPISLAVAEAAADGNTIPWSMADWPAGIASSLAPIVSQFYVSDMSGEELVNRLNDAFIEAAK